MHGGQSQAGSGGQQQQQTVKHGGQANAAAVANAAAAPPSRLFVASLLEPKDDLDNKHEACYQTVMTLISDKGEKEAHDALIKAADQAKTHEEVLFQAVFWGSIGLCGLSARNIEFLWNLAAIKNQTQGFFNRQLKNFFNRNLDFT